MTKCNLFSAWKVGVANAGGAHMILGVLTVSLVPSAYGKFVTSI
jgi:hypothetical protein